VPTGTANEPKHQKRRKSKKLSDGNADASQLSYCCD
jgi:hypothetical protein